VDRCAYNYPLKDKAILTQALSILEAKTQKRYVVLPGTRNTGTIRNITEHSRTPQKRGTPPRKPGTPQENRKSAKSKRIRTK